MNPLGAAVHSAMAWVRSVPEAVDREGVAGDAALAVKTARWLGVTVSARICSTGVEGRGEEPMSSTTLHIDPAAPQLPPAPPAQMSTSERAHRDQLLRMVALVVAIAGALLAGVGLTREPSPRGQETAPPPAPVAAAAPSTADVAAAKNEACDAWNAASTAIVTVRQPFVDKTQPGLVFDWNDPLIMFTLAQAQAGILAQIQYLRGHLAPATPPEVAGPVRDFIAATSDVIAADGQHQPAPLTNAAAERFNTAMATIRAACGG
jgi:hypothetical protein